MEKKGHLLGMRGGLFPSAGCDCPRFCVVFRLFKTTEDHLEKRAL